MDTDSFIVYKKTEDIYVDMLKQYLILQICYFELERPSPKGKNKKVIGLIKDGLGGKRMTN